MQSYADEDISPCHGMAEVKESDELEEEEGVNVPLVSDQRSNFQVL